MATWKLNECFAFFGAAGHNRRWSWSARSADGETVVVTLWRDRLSISGKAVVYDDMDIDTSAWQDRPGNKERLDNLRWARDRCDGYFKSVITVARDVNRQPRQIAECYPQRNFRMRLVELNDLTGGFRAHHVEPDR